MLSVTVYVETARDRHGDPVSTATEVLPAIGFAPSSGSSGRSSSTTTETVSSAQVRVTGVLYFPPGTRRFPASTVFEFREHPAALPTKWGIDGDLAEWVSPWGNWDAGSEVHIRRQTG